MSDQELRAKIEAGVNVFDAVKLSWDITQAELVAAVKLKIVRFAGARIIANNDLRTLSNHIFSYLDFTGAKFDGVNLGDAVFTGCVFERTQFSNIITGNVRFAQCSFNRASLSGEGFSGCSFAYSTIKDTHCVGTQFQNANFDNAKFVGCDFDSADCSGANFYASEVDGGTWDGVNFENAILRSCNFYPASMNGAQGLIYLYVPNASTRGDKLVAVLHTLPPTQDGNQVCKTMIKAGCFWGTLGEFETAVKVRINGDDTAYRAMIALIRAVWPNNRYADGFATTADHV